MSRVALAILLCLATASCGTPQPFGENIWKAVPRNSGAR